MITINIYGGENSLQIHSTDSSSPIVCNIYGGQNLISPEVKITQKENSEKSEKKNEAVFIPRRSRFRRPMKPLS